MTSNTMRSLATALLAALVFGCVFGCVPSSCQISPSKSELRRELHLCQSAHQSSKHQVDELQNRLQPLTEEVKELRCVIEAARSFTEAELEGVEQQFQNIHVAIPGQVQQEVGGRFDVVRMLIKSKFDHLNQQLTDLHQQLADLNRQLADTNQQLAQIQGQMADTHDLRVSLATGCGGLVAEIRDWDARMLCKGCELKIRDDKKREKIAMLHNQLVDAINGLKTQLLLEENSAMHKSAVGS